MSKVYDEMIITLGSDVLICLSIIPEYSVLEFSIEKRYWPANKDLEASRTFWNFLSKCFLADVFLFHLPMCVIPSVVNI